MAETSLTPSDIAAQAERWLSAPDYAGLYEVSDQGRVRSIRQAPPRLLARSNSGRRGGYLTVELWRDGKRRHRFVHVLVLRAFKGEAPSPAHRCAHDDGDCLHNRPGNLFWRTMQENMDDRERHGRTARGEAHGKVKMSEAQARRVKALLPTLGNRAIADSVGVTYKSVEAIRAGISWSHI